MEDRLMTIQQAADYLNLSRETLYKYAQRGMIPVARIGRHWRFDQRVLREWMAKSQEQAMQAVVSENAMASHSRRASADGVALDVLVVDDDPAVRRLLGVWIEAEGHRVDQVGTGAEAMTLLTTRQYNLVFLDLHMPGLTGGQVLGRLQEYDERPPVVLITGFTETPLMDQALHYDLLYVLSKPFTREQVRKLLHSARATITVPYPESETPTEPAHAPAAGVHSSRSAVFTDRTAGGG